MRLEKHIDTELRRMFGFNKSTNVSADDLKRVDVLSLENQSITSLGDLVNMTNLTALNISGTPIKDISHLSYCQELQRLAFYETSIKDISVLTNLQNLKELYFNEPLDEDNTHIISSLKELQLLDVSVTSGDLSFLHGLSKLKILHINTKEVDLKGIENLLNLEYLEIDAKSVKNWEYLETLPRLREIVYINVSSKEKDLISTMGYEINQVAEVSPFDPVFISGLSKFYLDSRLKQDATAMLGAFGVITLIVLLIGYGILIFNENATMNFWETTIMFSILFWFGVPISFWLYSMHFYLEFRDSTLFIRKMIRTYEIPYEEIKFVRRKHLSMRQPKIRIKTDDKTIRLTGSVFISNKKLVMLMNEFSNRGIETETKIQY